ncbi:MAG TPA: glycosyltransferase family 2 protein [Candidatus Acidoferrum sp.]|nr:glycosyltransferase family 2 protein [Candidatus Acidoferrum sp.]
MASLSVFLISLGFCAYTLFGYPLLLALAARFRHRVVRKGPMRTSVTVLLPVYNGERWIASKLESIRKLTYPAELVEILVLSDGSTDRTHEIVEGLACQANLRLIVLPRGGKAAALNKGIAAATGDILFFTDVRQELGPDSLDHLVECFCDPEVGAVSGELIIREGSGTEEASVGLYWKYEKWIRKQQSRIDSVLGTTGCIYAMRRELASPLPPGTLVDDMYLPLGAFFRGYRVILDDSAIAYDFPTQLASEFRRKVRTLAGVYQVIGQYPALLTPRNRMWIHFMSHKVARLLMPWAMLAAFLATFGLVPPWNGSALAVQVAGYCLAGVDFLIPNGVAPKRLTAPVRTFVVLMAASLCAVSIFFVPAGALWGETRVSGAANPRRADGTSD